MLERLAAARTPDELVAATPQLPGLLRSTEHYTIRRSYLLGAGVFALNPTNVALVAATALNLLGSPLSTTARLWVAVGFVAAAALPVLLPTLVLVVRGRRGEPVLRRLRAWVLHNNGFLSSGLLMLVGFLQISKGLDGLLL